MNTGDGSLKPGWTRVAFGEMATCVNERIDNPAMAGVERYVGLEHLDSDSLTIRRWGSPTDITATKLRFRKGDIIFGRRRVYQRKLAVADFDGIALHTQWFFERNLRWLCRGFSRSSCRATSS